MTKVYVVSIYGDHLTGDGKFRDIWGVYSNQLAAEETAHGYNKRADKIKARLTSTDAIEAAAVHAEVTTYQLYDTSEYKEGEGKQNDNQSNNDQTQTGEAGTASTHDAEGAFQALRRQTKNRPRLRAGS